VTPPSSQTSEDTVDVYVRCRLSGVILIHISSFGCQKLLADWTGTVEKIRTVPGFEPFLLPTSFPVLQTAAKESPVIIVNVSKIRSGAIIVLSDRPPLLVPLLDATPDTISSLAERTNSLATQKSMKVILSELWRLVVRPVVVKLTVDVKLARGSRIWWCPTGAASHLPLRAAGTIPNEKKHYRTGSFLHTLPP
jgi:hypothetical protein